MHGQFIWYELTTPDVAGAKKFYPAITGWGTQEFGKDYTMWTSGGVPYAGIFALSPEMRAQGIPPNWMPYIESANVDETARLAATLGGTVVVAPGDIPDVGRFAVLQDPQGATFGIYKSNRASQGWDGSQVPGQFSWQELMATDYSRAFAFYQKLFGWERIDEMDMGDGFTYFLYGQGGKMYGGMFNRPPEMSSMRPFWLSYIFVKNVPKAVEVATQRGAKLVRGPQPIPGGMIAILADPQGAGFAVHHADAAPAEPARKTGAAGAAGAAGKTAGKAAGQAAKATRSKRAAKAKAEKQASAPKARSARKTKGAAKRGGSTARGAKRSTAKRSTAKRSTAKRRAPARRGAKPKPRRTPTRRKR